MKLTIGRAAQVGALLFGGLISLQAQTTGGSLVGNVRDASGNTVAGATVTATETTTNAKTTATSDEKGEYDLLGLSPGTYALDVDAPGFKGYHQTGIHLALNQNGTQSVLLQVGAVQQTVDVQADVLGIDTVSSTNSTSVNRISIENLPLNTRESYSLLELVPGFSGSIGNDYNAVSYSIDGGDNQYGDVLVDGTPAGFPTVNGFQGVGVFPSVDAIGEFRLLAQGYPAEYGRTLDGILNVVYKNGTNAFHGSAFEFVRNNALDANDYFSKQNGFALPSFHRNQFGGSLGGPIIKDKTFFFVSTELLFQNAFQSILTTVPTLRQRQGDFSQTFGSNGQLIQIFDPFTTRKNPSGNGYIRDAFNGNVIPSARMSTVALNTLKYYPLPNVAGDSLTNSNNYFANGSSTEQTLSWDFRIDHTLSPNQKVFGRYSNRYFQDNPNPLFPKDQAVAEGLIDREDFSRGLTLGYTATPTAQTIFDVRVGFARTRFEYLNTSRGFQAASLGLPASINAFGGANIFPTFSADGYQQLGNEGNRHNAFMTYSLLPSFTWAHGHHVLKAGLDARMIRVNDNESNDSSGNFNFGTGFTQGPDPNAGSANSGNGLASLLLGTGTGDMIQNFKDVATQSFYYAGYFQDDWRVAKTLTLNLGVRYDLDTPRTERFNRMNYFDPNVVSPLASAVPGLTGGLVFVGTDSRSRYQYHVDKNNFAPRVGFSWAATPTTAVHGGGGIVYGASNQAAAGTVGPYGFRVQNTWVSTLDGITPLNTLDNPFPQGFQPPPGASGGLLTGVGGPIQGMYQTDPTPYTIQYGADVQQALPGEMTMTLAYVANRGRQLIQSYEGGLDFDQLPTQQLALGSALDDSVANPFFGTITTGALSAPTTSRAQLLLKYPQYTSLEPLRYPGGNSAYDSLQVSLNKRMSHGIQTQVSYVWARNFDNNSSHQDSFRPNADYAISYQDVRNRFVGSMIYELPFGRNRTFGRNESKVLDAFIGGWKVNSITTLQGGTPLQINANNDLSQYNFQNLYANTNFKNASLSGAVKNRLSRYFNTDDFSQPAPFTLGNGPAYYDNLRSPGYVNTDLSLFKEIHPLSEVTVQLRAEAFDVFNQTNFAGPDTTVTDSSFGVINSTQSSPRQLQFGIRATF